MIHPFHPGRLSTLNIDSTKIGLTWRMFGGRKIPPHTLPNGVVRGAPFGGHYMEPPARGPLRVYALFSKHGKHRRAYARVCEDCPEGPSQGRSCT